MADFQQYPAPVVFHQALVGVIPREDGDDLKFNFAVDGDHAGTETISGAGLAVKGKLLPLRIFPNPSQAGSLVQVTIDMYFDGTKLGSSRFFSSTGWKTEKFYMPSGSRGYIFQWKQIDNTNNNPRGYVGSFETDISISDVETPAVPS